MASPLCPQQASQLQHVLMSQVTTVAAQTIRVTFDLSISLPVNTLQVLLLSLLVPLPHFQLLTAFLFYCLTTWLLHSVHPLVFCI